MNETPTQNPRYNLLCRAVQATPDKSDPFFAVAPQLDALDALIHRDLLVLSRKASPDDFAEVFLDFDRELSRFREFVAYPHLASKTIVALGGAFSAGKSSLINALIGKNLMVVEVDPTTALPAYVLSGEEDAIYALNAHRLRIALTDDEFASLTHDEKAVHGSEVSRALSAAFVVRRDFPWGNLAFIDTPGYSAQNRTGGRTDAAIAMAQLNSAHAIIWVVNAKQGVISESDLDFLAKLDENIPKLIAISRADQVSEEDRDGILRQIERTLAQRNVPVLGVFPVSTQPRFETMLEPIALQLAAWNHRVQIETFSRRFKALFVRYQRGLERDRKEVLWQKNRINQILLLAENDVLKAAEELLAQNEAENKILEAVAEQLDTLRLRFFVEIKRLGDLVGIKLPEPHEVDLLEVGTSNLLDALVALREKERQPKPDVRMALVVLREEGEAKNRLQLTRRSHQSISLDVLREKTDAIFAPYLLRRTPKTIDFSALTTDETPAHRLHLLRRNPRIGAKNLEPLRNSF